MIISSHVIARSYYPPHHSPVGLKQYKGDNEDGDNLLIIDDED